MKEIASVDSEKFQIEIHVLIMPSWVSYDQVTNMCRKEQFVSLYKNNHFSAKKHNHSHYCTVCTYLHEFVRF